jgi:hypothetical protein
MYRAIVTPIFGSTRLCFSLWYNAPTMLPAGSLEVEFLCFQATGRQHRGCIITHAVTHSLVLPKMGVTISWYMLSWLELLINCYCCIQLVFTSFISMTHGETNIKFTNICLKILHTWRKKLTIRTERTGEKNRGGNAISMMNVTTVTSLSNDTGKWWAYQASEVGIHWDSKWIAAAVEEKMFKVKTKQVIVMQIK